MAKKRSAGSISAAQLRAAVEKAVKAEKVHGKMLIPPIHVRPGVIFGMQLDGSIGLAEASALAESITKSVAAPGLPKLTSAVLALKKQITVGFLDPSKLPNFLEL